MRLVNRVAELTAIDELLAGARERRSGVLVLRGEPGVGLTTLLSYAAESAAGMRVLRSPGVESEARLPFSALHRLCRPVLAGREGLPQRQRGALDAAFGLAAAPLPADRLLVALATLWLLDGAAAERPLLCLFDDAERFDEASGHVLAFLARRLDREGIAFLFAVRSPTEALVPYGALPALHVGGLSADDSSRLLASAASAPADPAAARRLIAEARGNPLALLELARGGPDAEAAVSATFPEPLALGPRLEQRFLARARELPQDTQAFLLVAAAAHFGDAPLIWDAARLLGIPPAAARAAESARLLRLEPEVTFRHALVRAAIYAAAPARERRETHAALAAAAEAAGSESHPWHHAAASPGADEAVAQGLDAAALHARTRGNHAAAATAFHRAARLTPSDSARVVERTLAAAQASLAAGSPGRAAALVAEARTRPLNERHHAEVARLRAAVSFTLGEGPESSELLLQAARELEPIDAPQARATYLEALEAAIFAGPVGDGGAALRAAQAARSAPAASGPATMEELLLSALTTLLLDGHEAGAPAAARAIDALLGTGDPRWLALGALLAMETWDDRALHELTVLQVRLTSEAAALRRLTVAVDQFAGIDEVLAGDFAAAEERFEEARDIAVLTGDPRVAIHLRAGETMVSAWRGQLLQAREGIARLEHEAVARGLGRYLVLAQYATAVLELGLGRYEAALGVARAVAASNALWMANFALPEVVEAAVRSGEHDVATEALARLVARTRPSRTEWGLGLLARSRALTAEDDAAEPLYEEAIGRLSRCRVVPQLARAHLLYGEWLRRQRRRRDARDQLATAQELFAGMGARAFAARAQAEEVATSAHPLPRGDASAAGQLTPRELQVAQLAGTGASNREIGTQLGISPRTVEHHLRKAYRKLKLGSRMELARRMRGSEQPVRGD